jgi:hypothetical protein
MHKPGQASSKSTNQYASFIPDTAPLASRLSFTCVRTRQNMSKCAESHKEQLICNAVLQQLVSRSSIPQALCHLSSAKMLKTMLL